MQTEQSAPEAESGEEAQQTPGQLLQLERERHGLSEKEVADKLHITMHYVRALESDNFDKLPGTVFARGYTKSYAELLSMDPVEMVSLHDRFTAQAKEIAAQAAAEGANPQGVRARTWWLLGVVAGIGCFGLLWAFDFLGPGSNPSPAVTAPGTAPDAQSAVGAQRSATSRYHGDMAIESSAQWNGHAPGNRAILRRRDESV